MSEIELDEDARGGLDERRRALDDAERDERARTDAERVDERALHDLTRQHERGSLQTQESLERERHDADASLDAERVKADRVRASDRRRSDRFLKREVAARARAEDALEANEDHATLRARELRGALRRARNELKVIEANVAVGLETVPRGPFEERVAERAALIRSAVDSLLRVLVDVLDADDVECDHHDVGGSG